MTKHMTAEEVAEGMFSEGRNAAHGDVWRAAHLRCGHIVREHLIPQWQDAPDADGWHWLENLAADAPPQLVTQFSPGGKWTVWTASGWVPLVGRVCPIGARPR